MMRYGVKAAAAAAQVSRPILTVVRGAASAALVFVSVFISPPAFAAVLPQFEAQTLEAARAAGRQRVSLAIVSNGGANSQTVAALEGLGGVVLFRDDDVGFVSAVAPIAQVERVLASPSVATLSVDQVIPAPPAPPPPRVAQGGAAVAPPPPPQTPPSQTTDPLAHLYPFSRDIGAAELRSRHPTYDGRGVLVAHVEGFPDFLLPELQTALDLNGRPIPKFADIVNIRDWGADQLGYAQPEGLEGWRWVRLSTSIRPRDGRIDLEQTAYRVPGGGEPVRLGRLVIPNWILVAVDPRRTGTGEFAVLWSESSQQAWIDVDGDRDFTDETPARIYSQGGRFAVFGVDDPTTPRRETMAYTVQREGDYLSFNFGMDAHATMVAGDVAARRGSQGRIDGIAPGAQLLTIAPGQTISSLARALIFAFGSNADLVLYEPFYPMFGFQGSEGGQATIELLLSRLVERFDKPVVIPAGNLPGLNSVRNPSPDNAIVVGAAQSRGATLAHYGFMMDRDYALHWISSEGPRGDGSLKPDVLAPVNNMSLGAGFLDGATIAGLYALPPGYRIGGGTSSAAPVAAGVTALLVSAARQSQIQISAARLREALQSSALFLPNVAAHQQGAGLVRAGAAWRSLREMRGQPAFRIEIEAPVETTASLHFADPGSGNGLFLRDGIRGAPTSQQAVRMTRMSGPASPIAFDLAWIGNDSRAFQSPRRVTLPLGTPVSLAIDVRVPEEGVRSAILELRRQGRTHARLLATVVTPLDLEQGRGLSISRRVSLDRPGRRDLFIRVPEAAQALIIRIPGQDRTLMGAIGAPDGRREQGLTMIDPTTGIGSRTINNPAPGIWQITLMDFSGRLAFDPTTASSVPRPRTVQIEVAVAR